MDSFERQLVSKLKMGEQESFAVLYEQYSKKIYNLAFRMCGNKEDSDDIVQRTFIQAFTNINSFRETSGLYTWLYTIAKNLCLRLLENRKRASFSSLDTLINTAQSRGNQNDFTDVEKQYYINQVKEGCLEGLIRCLSFYQRIAFILNVLLDVKVKDISAILNKTETATKMLVHHAKRNIRSFLCKNCSLYKPGNPCHCENLINYSLKQGWIQKIPDKASDRPRITALVIEKEISDLKKMVMLYNSLEDRQPSENVIHFIQKEISKPTYSIFYCKKVK
jgi:RNA polymerase sigma-70 factor (ECF subfamily)